MQKNFDKKVYHFRFKVKLNRFIILRFSIPVLTSSGVSEMLRLQPSMIPYRGHLVIIVKTILSLKIFL